jgi:hypothetical protein
MVTSFVGKSFSAAESASMEKLPKSHSDKPSNTNFFLHLDRFIWSSSLPFFD